MWGGVREGSWGFKVGFCRRCKSLPGTQGQKRFLHIQSLICPFTPIVFLPPPCSPSPAPFSSSFLSLPFRFLSALTSLLHVFFFAPNILPLLFLLSFLSLSSLSCPWGGGGGGGAGWRGRVQAQMKQLSQPTAPPTPGPLPAAWWGEGKHSWNRWARGGVQTTASTPPFTAALFTI